MDPWELHEIYPTLDIKDVSGYPNKPPPKYDKNLPRFNDDPCHVVKHVLSLVRHASTFEGRHEDLLIRSFICMLIGMGIFDRGICAPKKWNETPYTLGPSFSSIGQVLLGVCP
jgi:hypothetical protein